MERWTWLLALGSSFSLLSLASPDSYRLFLFSAGCSCFLFALCKLFPLPCTSLFLSLLNFSSFFFSISLYSLSLSLLNFSSFFQLPFTLFPSLSLIFPLFFYLSLYFFPLDSQGTGIFCSFLLPSFSTLLLFFFLLLPFFFCFPPPSSSLLVLKIATYRFLYSHHHSPNCSLPLTPTLFPLSFPPTLFSLSHGSFFSLSSPPALFSLFFTTTLFLLSFLPLLFLSLSYIHSSFLSSSFLSLSLSPSLHLSFCIIHPIFSSLIVSSFFSPFYNCLSLSFLH
ncbi:unnamed protein product [Acanthosepion pharaonis]|uniref:Uncharacterized protein n=1 Tax=Acanthosepion pharaonis TaxID=158019 RepID=A0A812DVC3_ACAPH|nr:unnamed protein product [Sepia pharaonis]